MEILVGNIMNYYRRIGVASVKLTDRLKAGSFIHIKGQTTDFDQYVQSIQINHKDISEAFRGQTIGLKVDDYVRPHDRVYRVEK